MRGFFPIILLGLSGLIFHLFIDPTYDKIQENQQEVAAYENALENSNQLIAVRDQLGDIRASFPQEDLDRLDVLLPKNVDTIRLIMEFDGITSRHDLTMQNLNITTSRAQSASAVAQSADESGPRGRVTESVPVSPIQEITLAFSVAGEYETVRQFIGDLERSLRIIDIQSLDFSGVEGESSYSLEVKTYWMN